MDQDRIRISDLRQDIRDLRREFQDATRGQNQEIAGLRIDITKIRETLAALKVKTGILSAIGGATAGGAAGLLRHFLGK